MSQTASARRTPPRAVRPAAVGLVILSAAVGTTIIVQSAPPSGSSSSASPSGSSFGHVPRDDRRGAVTEADGALPGGVTVFADEYPGVANLDADLLDALREAATDAADDGIVFLVNSGWRSPDYQEQLLREAVAEHGSEEEAARWVASAATSAHVAGDAADIGPVAATAWLAEHGAGYGLCQIYANEPWHHELRPPAIDRGCPPMYADPTHDPRMH